MQFTMISHNLQGLSSGWNVRMSAQAQISYWLSATERIKQTWQSSLNTVEKSIFLGRAREYFISNQRKQQILKMLFEIIIFPADSKEFTENLEFFRCHARIQTYIDPGNRLSRVIVAWLVRYNQPLACSYHRKFISELRSSPRRAHKSTCTRFQFPF